MTKNMERGGRWRRRRIGLRRKTRKEGDEKEEGRRRDKEGGRWRSREEGREGIGRKEDGYRGEWSSCKWVKNINKWSIPM
jgi:hypothetical protein